MKQKEEEKQDYGLMSLQAIAKTPDGRRALNFIMHLTPFYEGTFTGDPYKDAFLNGQRHIALILRGFFDKDLLSLIEQEEI